MRKLITSMLCISPLLLSVPSQAWASGQQKKKHHSSSNNHKKPDRTALKGQKGDQGPKGEQGAKGEQGLMGRPAIVAYGQVATELKNGEEIKIKEPGAVPMNKPANTSPNVSYDDTTKTFTVKDAGTYMIDYFLQAQYQALPLPAVDGVLSVAVEINGKNEGDSQLYPADVRFNQFFILVGSGSRRLIKDLPAGSTIRLVIPTVPKTVSDENDKGVKMFNNGTGPDTSAYISIIKVG